MLKTIFTKDLSDTLLSIYPSLNAIDNNSLIYHGNDIALRIVEHIPSKILREIMNFWHPSESVLYITGLPVDKAPPDAL